MLTKLIMVRHGQTDFNLQRRYCGFSDVELNDTGIAQAKKLSGAVAGEKIDKVYSSDLKRVVRFSQIVMPQAAAEKMGELREINFGIFEGLTHEEISGKHPGIYQDWLANPFSVVIPQGESLGDVSLRVRRALQKILTGNRGKTVIVFTHAGPIRIILADILKINLKDIWQISQDCAAVNRIEFSDSGINVISRNDTGYLK